MARSGSCAAQSGCEKRNEEGPNTWPVSSRTVLPKPQASSVFVKSNLSLWKRELKWLYAPSQESFTSGSGSGSSQDTDVSLPGVLMSTDVPAKGNYDRTLGILYHEMGFFHLLTSRLLDPSWYRGASTIISGSWSREAQVFEGVQCRQQPERLPECQARHRMEHT